MDVGKAHIDKYLKHLTNTYCAGGQCQLLRAKLSNLGSPQSALRPRHVECPAGTKHCHVAAVAVPSNKFKSFALRKVFCGVPVTVCGSVCVRLLGSTLLEDCRTVKSTFALVTPQKYP